MKQLTLTNTYRAIAVALRVKDPDGEFSKLVERNGGDEPSAESWRGWCEHADKKPIEREPDPQWEPPRDWDEALAYDPRGDIAIKELEAISTMLEEKYPSTRKTTPDVGDDSNPLCVCKARARAGFSTPCLACTGKVA